MELLKAIHEITPAIVGLVFLRVQKSNSHFKQKYNFYPGNHKHKKKLLQYHNKNFNYF